MLSKGVSSLVFCAVSGFLNQWKVCEPGSFPCWIAGQLSDVSADAALLARLSRKAQAVGMTEVQLC